MKKAIKNNTVRIIITGDLTLLPGVNYVESFLCDKNKAIIDDKVKSGDIEFPEVEIEDDFAETLLGGLNAKDAVALIKNTNDLDTLENFLEEEKGEKSRKKVIEAINKQIELSKEALKGDE